MLQPSALEGRAVFLSASIPDPQRWSGAFDTLEITDAVVAAGRSVLTAGGALVTAAHPTIAPLLLYVASEFPSSDAPRVIVYQSRLFDRVLPEATLRFEELGVGILVWTDAAEGDAPVPNRWDESLRLMRTKMLRDTDPAAAIFVGGMDGIRIEYEAFLEMFPARPVYPLGRPGGEARELAASLTSSLSRVLNSGDVYPAVFRRVIADLASQLE
jgi:hypothetical protein